MILLIVIEVMHVGNWNQQNYSYDVSSIYFCLKSVKGFSVVLSLFVIQGSQKHSLQKRLEEMRLRGALIIIDSHCLWNSAIGCK